MIGILIYTIHSTNKKPLKLFGTDVDAYKRFAADVKLGKYPNLNCIPNGIVDNVRLMLHFSPELRPNLFELPKVHYIAYTTAPAQHFPNNINIHLSLQISYFDDFGVKTLIYLESLYQFDNVQKSKFFKGLPQILEKFPKRVNVRQILPCLVREFVNTAMIPFVLPNVLLIVQGCATPNEYRNDIQRHLLPVMKITNPIQILLIFMQNIELLIKLSPAPVIKSDILELINRALECEVKEIQELGLAISPTIATHIDYAVLKNGLFPRIKTLSINTPAVSVKVNSLICLGKLLEVFDKWFVLDDVIPYLIQIKSRDPAVLMGVIGEYLYRWSWLMTHKDDRILQCFVPTFHRHIQTHIDAQEIGHDQRSNGHQGHTVPGAAEHWEWPNGDTIQHDHADGQGDFVDHWKRTSIPLGTVELSSRGIQVCIIHGKI